MDVGLGLLRSRRAHPVHVHVRRTPVKPRLPYCWARAHRALIQASAAPGVVLTTSERTPDWALVEIRRCHGELAHRVMPDAELDTLLAAAYAQTGDAATVVDEAASEIDLDRLMQDIRPVEDLLEAQDDAPVIRMINEIGRAHV